MGGIDVEGDVSNLSKGVDDHPIVDCRMPIRIMRGTAQTPNLRKPSLNLLLAWRQNAGVFFFVVSLVDLILLGLVVGGGDGVDVIIGGSRGAA